MLEKAKETTRYKQYTAVQYARFADDLVILVDSHPRHDWLEKAVTKRLREELGKTTSPNQRREESDCRPQEERKFWLSRI